jgi:hypothetical protein
MSESTSSCCFESEESTRKYFCWPVKEVMAQQLRVYFIGRTVQLVLYMRAWYTIHLNLYNTLWCTQAEKEKFKRKWESNRMYTEDLEATNSRCLLCLCACCAHVYCMHVVCEWIWVLEELACDMLILIYALSQILNCVGLSTLNRTVGAYGMQCMLLTICAWYIRVASEQSYPPSSSAPA